MKLLITGAWKASESQLEEIEKMGHNIIFMQNEQDKLPCTYEEVEGIICNGLFLHHSIEKFVSLKYIQLTSAGYDRVPLEYVLQNNIKIFNARGVYSIPMAEFAVCGVLQIYKNVRFFYNNQINKSWQKNRNILELYGKRVCILGCGSVGIECAKRFKVFGTTVIGIDINPCQNKFFDCMYGIDNLDTELSVADIVVLTLPLTQETKHIINKKRLLSMKKNAVIVNISRGAVIDEIALIDVLNNNYLLGAVLDVFEEEPLDVNSLLWENKKIILTPHNSFVGEKNSDRLYSVIIKNLNNV